MGVCIFAGDFVLDIEETLRHLNENISKATGQQSHNHAKFKKIFVDNIRFHSDAKELSVSSFIELFFFSEKSYF